MVKQRMPHVRRRHAPTCQILLLERQYARHTIHPAPHLLHSPSRLAHTCGEMKYITFTPRSCASRANRLFIPHESTQITRSGRLVSRYPRIHFSIASTSRQRNAPDPHRRVTHRIVMNNRPGRPKFRTAQRVDDDLPITAAQTCGIRFAACWSPLFSPTQKSTRLAMRSSLRR